MRRTRGCHQEVSRPHRTRQPGPAYAFPRERPCSTHLVGEPNPRSLPHAAEPLQTGRAVPPLELVPQAVALQRTVVHNDVALAIDAILQEAWTAMYVSGTERTLDD